MEVYPSGKETMAVGSLQSSDETMMDKSGFIRLWLTAVWIRNTYGYSSGSTRRHVM